MTMMTVVKTIG